MYNPAFLYLFGVFILYLYINWKPYGKTKRNAMISLLLFFSGIIFALNFNFPLESPINIQTIFIIITFLILITTEINYSDFLSKFMIHPVSVMIAGFFLGGALLVSGGSEKITNLAIYVSEHTPFGYTGITVIFINISLIFPLPCGRITAMMFLPSFIGFIKHYISEVFINNGGNIVAGNSIIFILTGAFIINSASSCSASCAGGMINLVENYMRLHHNRLQKLQQLSALITTIITVIILNIFLNQGVVN